MSGQREEARAQLEDIEASQGLLSAREGESPEPASPVDPTSTMAPLKAVDEARKKSDAVAGAVVIASVAAVTLSTWAIVLSNNPSALGWFAPHPTLQTLGLSLITYGIFTVQPTSFADPNAKAASLTRHQLAIFVLALPSLLLGSYSIWHNKDLAHKPHITTWHGTLGVACLAWMGFQVFLGVGSVWWKGALFGGGMKAKAVWKYHRLSGYILFPLFFSTVHLGGAWSAWAVATIPWYIRFLVYTLAPALVLAGTFWRMRTNKMKFF